MIGSVTADSGEPWLPMMVLGTATDAPGRVEVQAVVDTDFDGELQLPPDLVQRLGHQYEGSARGTLADGSVSFSNHHTSRVLWHGAEREVVSYGDPLIGMTLLNGNRLTVDAVPGGVVRIEELP